MVHQHETLERYKPNKNVAKSRSLASDRLIWQRLWRHQQSPDLANLHCQRNTSTAISRFHRK